MSKEPTDTQVREVIKHVAELLQKLYEDSDNVSIAITIDAIYDEVVSSQYVHTGAADELIQAMNIHMRHILAIKLKENGEQSEYEFVTGKEKTKH